MPAGAMQAIVLKNPKIRPGQEFVRVGLFGEDGLPYDLSGGDSVPAPPPLPVLRFKVGSKTSAPVKTSDPLPTGEIRFDQNDANHWNIGNVWLSNASMDGAYTAAFLNRALSNAGGDGLLIVSEDDPDNIWVRLTIWSVAPSYPLGAKTDWMSDEVSVDTTGSLDKLPAPGSIVRVYAQPMTSKTLQDVGLPLNILGSVAVSAYTGLFVPVVSATARLEKIRYALQAGTATAQLTVNGANQSSAFNLSTTPATKNIGKTFADGDLLGLNVTAAAGASNLICTAYMNYGF